MTDPTDPLAHLYAEDGSGGDDLEDVVPNRKTDLESLIEGDGPEVEEISDEDVAELALLVKARQDAGTSSDEFLHDLGLGDFVDLDGTPDLHLNAVGLAVVRHLAEEEGLIPRGS